MHRCAMQYMTEPTSMRQQAAPKADIIYSNTRHIALYSTTISLVSPYRTSHPICVCPNTLQHPKATSRDMLGA